MNSPLIKVRAGAFDVVAVDGRIRVVRRRDGAAVGSLPLVDEPTFGDALKEAVSRAASAKSRPNVEPSVAAALPEEPKKKRRARSKTKPAKAVEPAPASVAPDESPALAAPEPEEFAVENLEKIDNEET